MKEIRIGDGERQMLAGMILPHANERALMLLAVGRGLDLSRAWESWIDYRTNERVFRQ